jgi:hypothetical protein
VSLNESLDGAVGGCFDYRLPLDYLRVTEEELVLTLAGARKTYPHGTSYALTWDERDDSQRVVYLTESAAQYLLREWVNTFLARFRRLRMEVDAQRDAKVRRHMAQDA